MFKRGTKFLNTKKITQLIKNIDGEVTSKKHFSINERIIQIISIQ